MRITVRKAFWLPHFGHLRNYRIFLQENSSIHFTIQCRQAVIPGLESPGCPTLMSHKTVMGQFSPGGLGAYVMEETREASA